MAKPDNGILWRSWRLWHLTPAGWVAGSCQPRGGTLRTAYDSPSTRVITARHNLIGWKAGHTTSGTKELWVSSHPDEVEAVERLRSQYGLAPESMGEI